METIREYRDGEIPAIAAILAPAFRDKVMAITGDEARALRILPAILRSVSGVILVAEDEGVPVGAIVLSTTEYRITPPVVWACVRVLGIRGSWCALGVVNDYLKSEPVKLDSEGRLEAVGVLPEHQGRGIGKELVVAGERALRSRGIDHFGLGVRVGNPAYRLYKGLGFTEVGRYANGLGEWIYMRKDIGSRIG